MKRATYKLVLYAKVLKDGNQPVYLRATFNRQSRVYSLGRYCTPEQWDEGAGRFLKTYPGHKRENAVLATYEQRASDALYSFERDGIAFTFEKFERLVFPDQHAGGAMRFADWLKRIEQENIDRGSPGNAHFYREAARAVAQFSPRSTLSNIDSKWLSAFERWAGVNRNLSQGGLLALLRNMRAGCNRAVADGIMSKEWNPFPAYKLTHLRSKKAKKGAPLDFFRALESVDRSALTYMQALAVDLFLFSFYCRGMNLADIAELTEKNVQGGQLSYVRKKTGKEYIMPLSGKRALIVARYAGTGPYLFPVIPKKKSAEQYRQRVGDNLSRRVNKALRQVADLIGWKVDRLSFYTARHSYGEILDKAGVRREVIQEAMGHSALSTTEHYLRGFGNSVLDDADRFVLN